MSNSTDALSPELPAASGLDDAAAQEGMTTQTKSESILLLPRSDES